MTPSFIDTELDGVRWLPFRNNTLFEIPSYGVIRVESSEYDSAVGRTILIGERPNAYGSQYNHYINGPTPVPSGGKGACSNCFPLPVRIDPDSLTISVGDVVGPRSGSFKIFGKTGGFRVISPERNNAVYVERYPMLWTKVKATADIPTGTFGSCNVMWGDEGSELELTDIGLLVYNRYADIRVDSIGMAKINHDTNRWEFQNANVCQDVV